MTKKLSPILKSINVADINAIGIDVAKDTLAIFFSSLNKEKEKYIVLRNTDIDITNLAQQLNGYTGTIVMESTGRHHLLSAIILTEHSLDVRVINPLMTQKYSRAAIRKVKTDKEDARVLAEIALKEERLPSLFRMDRKMLNIRKKISLIASIETQLQQFRSTINDYAETKKILHLELSESEEKVMAIIKELEQQKTKLEREVEREAKDLDDDDSDQINRFTSIPGVSSFAATLSSFLFSTDHLESSKQWIAYCGMDISVRQSGVWNGRGKLTKRGDPYLRKRIYSAAWGAVMNDNEFRKYYDQLKQGGRKHTEAIVIVARKLIRIMFSLAKNKTAYDSSKLLFNI